MIKFQCSACAQLFGVETDCLGEEVQCPHCQNLQRLPTSRLVAGSVLGEFIIRNKIASWEKGKIYDAVQISLNRHVALKVLFPEFNTDSNIKAFISEARQDAQMDFPHIGQVFVAGEDGNIYYYSMENINTSNTNTTTFMQEIIIQRPAEGRDANIPLAKAVRTPEYVPTPLVQPPPPAATPLKPLLAGNAPPRQPGGEGIKPAVNNTGTQQKTQMKVPGAKPKPVFTTKPSSTKLQFKVKK